MLYRGDDRRRLTRLIAIADDAAVPLIAVNDVLYHAPERRPLQDIVTCIREHVTIETAGRRLEANAERHLKPPQEMARLFRAASGGDRADGRTSSSAAHSRSRSCARRNIRTRPAQASPPRRMRWSPLVKEGVQRRYPNGIEGACPRSARQGARHHRRAQIRALLPDRPRHRAVCALERHPVPGPRLGGEFRDLLLPRHHRGRSREGRSAVRALRLRRTARAARHRRRLRARAARGGDPVHLQSIWPRARRP